MGYRIDIRDTKNPNLRFYGTKLYGYVHDESKLLSCQYLISIGKINDDVFIWDYPFPHEITLTAEEFREFMQLYEKDFDGFGKYGTLSEYPDYSVIQELMKTDSDKFIDWG